MDGLSVGWSGEIRRITAYCRFLKPLLNKVQFCAVYYYSGYNIYFRRNLSITILAFTMNITRIHFYTTDTPLIINLHSISYSPWVDLETVALTDTFHFLIVIYLPPVPFSCDCSGSDMKYSRQWHGLACITGSSSSGAINYSQFPWQPRQLEHSGNFFSPVYFETIEIKDQKLTGNKTEVEMHVQQ